MISQTSAEAIGSDVLLLEDDSDEHLPLETFDLDEFLLQEGWAGWADEKSFYHVKKITMTASTGLENGAVLTVMAEDRDEGFITSWNTLLRHSDDRLKQELLVYFL